MAKVKVKKEKDVQITVWERDAVYATQELSRIMKGNPDRILWIKTRGGGKDKEYALFGNDIASPKGPLYSKTPKV